MNLLWLGIALGFVVGCFSRQLLSLLIIAMMPIGVGLMWLGQVRYGPHAIVALGIALLGVGLVAHVLALAIVGGTVLALTVGGFLLLQSAFG